MIRDLRKFGQKRPRLVKGCVRQSMYSLDTTTSEQSRTRAAIVLTTSCSYLKLIATLSSEFFHQCLAYCVIWSIPDIPPASGAEEMIRQKSTDQGKSRIDVGLLLLRF